MAEVAPAGGGGVNRNFLFIVGGLAALLVIGLLGVGALLLLPGLVGGNKTPVALATASPTRVAIAATATKLAVQATATLVVSGNGTDTPVSIAQASTPTKTGGFATATLTPATTGTPTSGAALTPTASGTTTKGGLPIATSTPSTGGGGLPQSGIGDSLLWLAAGLALVVVVFGARRLRNSG